MLTIRDDHVGNYFNNKFIPLYHVGYFINGDRRKLIAEYVCHETIQINHMRTCQKLNFLLFRKQNHEITFCLQYKVRQTCIPMHTHLSLIFILCHHAMYFKFILFISYNNLVMSYILNSHYLLITTTLYVMHFEFTLSTSQLVCVYFIF